MIFLIQGWRLEPGIDPAVNPGARFVHSQGRNHLWAVQRQEVLQGVRRHLRHGHRVRRL